MRDFSKVAHKSHRQRYFQIYFLKCGDNGLLQDKNILGACVKSYFCSPVTLLGSEMHIGFWSHFRRDFWLRQSFWLFPLLDQDWLWLQLRPQRQWRVDFCSNCTVSSALSLWNLFVKLFLFCHIWMSNSHQSSSHSFFLWNYFSFIIFAWATLTIELKLLVKLFLFCHIGMGNSHHWAPQTVFQMTGSPPPETSAPLKETCLKSKGH